MKYVHLFDTQSEHDSVYETAEYKEPWLGYIIENNNATFNKEPLSLRLRAASASKKYDGATLSSNSYEIVQGKLANNHHISNIVISGQITDVGEVANEITSVTIRDNNNIDVTNKYNITCVSGTLTVTKRNITMLSYDDAKPYDGTSLTNDEIDIVGDGFADGEGATYDVTGTQTLVGSSGNTFTYTLNQGTHANNYRIITIAGTLTVTDGTGLDDEPVPDDLVVTISLPTDEHGNEKRYRCGDTITATIDVTNIYDEQKSLLLETIEGAIIIGEVNSYIVGGERIRSTVQYTVTSSDEAAGVVVISVYATIGTLEKIATCEAVIITSAR